MTTVNRETAIATLQGIRAAAESALADGVACVCLTLRREHPPTGEKVLLYGHSGPRGELLNATANGTGKDHHWKVVARFRAAKLITCTTKTIETLLKAA
jgi:hypothetical protein